MIRKEAVSLPGPDPRGQAKLQAFRSQIQELDARVADAAQRQRDFARLRGSQAREAKFEELHARMQGADAGHRPPDREFPVRPLSIADKDLWTFDNIRAWYSGADATMSNSLPEPAELAAHAPSGPSLARSGYLVPVDRAQLERVRAAKAEREADLARSTVAAPADAATNARATARAHWLEPSARAAHWLDRSTVLESERRLAQRTLEATHYSPGLVAAGRPFKTDFSSSGTVGWREPTPAELLLKEGLKYDAARAYSTSTARQRKLDLTASRPSDYFGGGDGPGHGGY